MRHLAIVLLFAFTAAIHGQTIQERVAKLDGGKKYEVAYDKFKDRTSVRSPQRVLKNLRKGWGTGLGWYIAMEFEGKELKGEPTYWLVFRDYGGGDYWRDRDLIALADGARLGLGRGSYDNAVNSSNWGGRRTVSVSQWMMYKLSPENWKAISAASHLEFQIGDVEGRLDEDAYPILRDMASLAK